MTESMHRVKFEAWASGKGMPVHRRYRLDEYGNAHTQQCWEAWQASIPDELRAIGQLIDTQDNRATDQPIFIVQQKREHPAADGHDFDRIAWVDFDGEEADEETAAALDREHEDFSDPPEGWARVAMVSHWEFVTACFTAKGCEDYIAANGHNLKEPRIYADGSYRNAEFRALRTFLLGLSCQKEPKHG